MKRTDLRGQIFARLMVIGFADMNKWHGANYWCECDCGEYLIVLQNNLRSGGCRSCGCLRRETNRKRVHVMCLHNTIHGHAKGKKSTTYFSWRAMIQRCKDPNQKYFKNYGGRGITVCERWLKFENFLADMGKKPSRLTLERINNNGNYELSNCKWATYKEQANNKRPKK